LPTARGLPDPAPLGPHSHSLTACSMLHAPCSMLHVPRPRSCSCPSGSLSRLPPHSTPSPFTFGTPPHLTSPHDTTRHIHSVSASLGPSPKATCWPAGLLLTMPPRTHPPTSTTHPLHPLHLQGSLTLHTLTRLARRGDLPPLTLTLTVTVTVILPHRHRHRVPRRSGFIWPVPGTSSLA
jgi:hypothetical protein